MQPFEFLAQRLEVGGVQLYSCSGFRIAPLIWFMPLSFFLGRKDADVKSHSRTFLWVPELLREFFHIWPKTGPVLPPAQRHVEVVRFRWRCWHHGRAQEKRVVAIAGFRRAKTCVRRALRVFHRLDRLIIGPQAEPFRDRAK